jgi:ADP-ribose pyrophosphatase YjhB (NUDIX family)
MSKHCGHCGARWPDPELPWPRLCPGCQQKTYRNPAPAAVLLIPVLDHPTIGFLGVRRAIPPFVGEVALVSGYVESGEDWRVGAAREVTEETSGLVTLDPNKIHVFDVESSTTNPDVLLIFATAPPIPTLPTGFVPNEEVTELVVLDTLSPIPFQLHRKAIRDYTLDYVRLSGHKASISSIATKTD